MPIVETLGLKVKATDSGSTSVVQFLEPIRPFFIRASLRDELGVKLCSRVNTRKWTLENDESAAGESCELNDEQRTLLESVSEPKAVIEWLLSNKYGAHDQSYHDYPPDTPLYKRKSFGMSQNSVILDVNRKPEDGR